LLFLGANNTNTAADNEAINLEAEAIADEFNRLMTTSTYKGKDVFVAAAGNQEIAMGGRGAEMTFGIGDISYTSLYSTARTIAGEPNDGESFNLAHLPSDGIVAKSYGLNANSSATAVSDLTLEAGKKYVLRSVDTTDERDMTDNTNDTSAVDLRTGVLAGKATVTDRAGTAVGPSTLDEGDFVTVTEDVILSAASSTGPAVTLDTIVDAGSAVAGTYTDVAVTGGNGTGLTVDITIAVDGTVTNLVLNDAGDNYQVDDTLTITTTALSSDTNVTFDIASVSTTTPIYAEVNESATAFQSGETYVIQTMGSSTGDVDTAADDAAFIAAAFTDENGNALSGTLAIGQKIKMAAVGDTTTVTVTQKHLDAANALIQGMTFTMSTDSLTSDIEAVQALVNRARVEAGSQYAALESAVAYTTDLTAQYELGFNTVNDVNFSAETAHLAKNQILQQAATAMLAQANSGQQGLLQLIQG